MRPGKNMVNYTQKQIFINFFKGGSIMLLDREYKIPSKVNKKINLKVVPGLCHNSFTYQFLYGHDYIEGAALRGNGSSADDGCGVPVQQAC